MSTEHRGGARLGAGRKPYIGSPQEGSLRYQLLDYFNRNEDEELLFGDALVKFDTRTLTLRKTLESMRKRREVASPCPSCEQSNLPIRPPRV